MVVEQQKFLGGLEATWHMDKPGRARGLRCSIPSFSEAETETSSRAKAKAMILTVLLAVDTHTPVVLHCGVLCCTVLYSNLLTAFNVNLVNATVESYTSTSIRLCYCRREYSLLYSHNNSHLA